MTKQKFATLFSACALFCLAAGRPAFSDDYMVTGLKGIDNQLYTLTFNPQPPPPNLSSLNLIGTDLTTGNTQTMSGFTLAEHYQSLAGFTALPGRTFASSSYYSGTVYLYLFGATVQTLKVSGLPTAGSYITALVGLKDGTLLALVNPRNGGNSGFFLETLNLQSAEATDTGFPFPSDRSFSGLTQCPDGTIYALASGSNYSKSLVQLDLNQQQVVEGPTLGQSGQRPISTRSLACSPQGDLLVEGVRNADANAGEGSFLPPDLFSVNKNSGELTTVSQPFNYAGGITFVPTRAGWKKPK